MKTNHALSIGFLFLVSVFQLWAQSNTFPASGNVGVGTTSPGSIGTNITTIDLKGLATDRSGGVLFSSSNNSQSAFIADVDSVFQVRTISSIPMSFWTANSEVMRITAAGNVGIGTTAPNAWLDVKGYNPQMPTLNLGRSYDGSRMQFHYGSDSTTSGEIGMTYHTAGGVTLWMGANLNSTGTSHSSSPLQAVSSKPSWLTLHSSQSDYYHVDRIAPGGGSTTMFTIVDSGNVGIGTLSPSHKLAVNGAIRAKEVIVDTGWSDYVFAADYRLAPLSEVEAHIQAKKRLPGIPSAAEVETQGVSVGEMQSKLLAKIEELTLHLIAQEKAMTAVKEENARLSARFEHLERR